MKPASIQTGAAALLLFFALPVAAGWSDDPAVNTPVAVKVGELIQPKMALRADGGLYVSWFENTGSGYDVYLQRLDADGNRLWGEDGVVVAERSFSSTEDYGLDVDTAGYAVLAFRDDRFDGVTITASRVSPDGDLDWGSDGVQLVDDPDFVAGPRIAAASDGSIVTAWFEDGATALAGLDSTGEVQWTGSVSDDVGLAISDLHATDSPGETGQVIALMATLGSFMDPRYLYAQKFNAEGETLWGDDPVQIFDTGSLQFGDFPVFRPDGAGGLAVAWYQTQTTAPELQVYAQHLDDQGQAQLDAGGLAVSTLTSQLRTAPALTLDPASMDMYVFWRETDSQQSQIGLYGQRIDSAGQRQWGDEAAEFIGLGSSGDVVQVRTTIIDGEPVTSAVTGSGLLEAFRVGADAEPVWDPDFSPVSDTAAAPARSSLMADGTGQAGLLVWNDDRAGDADIYAQRLRADGSLGGEATKPGLPVIALDPETLSTALVAGQSATLVLTIANEGEQTLEWAVDQDGDCQLPDWVGIDPDAGTLPEDASQAVEATFHATDLEPGQYQAALCIASNDPENAQVEIELALDVLAPAIFHDRFEELPDPR